MLTGEDGARIGLYAAPAPLDSNGDTNMFCGDGCIDLTMLDFSFAGATVNLSANAYHAPQSQFVISPAGDSVFYLDASTNGTCQNVDVNANPDGSYTYDGPTIQDCSIEAKNTDPGRWTVVKAPELNGALAVYALTFLLGGLAVLRDRKKIRR